MTIRDIIIKYSQELEKISDTPRLDVELFLQKALGGVDRIYIHLNLNKKIQTRDERISDLENRLEFAEDTIDMLEDKVSKLQEALDYFKELWKKFIKFLQDKFFSSNKYDDLIDELHDEEIIDNDDLEVIQNEFSRYNSKDDDLER